MSKILFSALVSKASGKFGGSCFRIHRNAQLLTKLGFPNQSAASRSNAARPVIAHTFRQWALISDAARIAWSALAADNPVLDRWGNNKLLTGREFFIKFSFHRYRNSYPPQDPADFKAEIPLSHCTEITISTSEATFNNADFAAPALGWGEIYSRPISSNLIHLKPYKLKWVCNSVKMGNDPSAAYMDAYATGLRWEVGKWYSVAVRGVSASGVPGAWSQFNVLVT